jgi:RNA polymerase sigma-70 factor (ECF subfamily)
MYVQTDEQFEQLINGARAGSSQALGRLLERFRYYLLRCSNAEIGPDLQSKGSASDLVQDTFMDAHRSFSVFSGGSPEQFRAWLRRILVRKLANFRRHYRATCKRQSAREISLEASGIVTQLAIESSVQSPSPSWTVAQGEQIEHMRIAFQSLPQLYRDVIGMRFRDKMPFDRIGQQIGCSAEAARKTWLRSIKRLARSMPRN